MSGHRRFMALTAALVLVTAACDWGMTGYGPARTGFSSQEQAITAANIGTLTEAWNSGPGTVNASVVVGSGKAFVTAGPGTVDNPASLEAFNVDSAANCRGSAPSVCPPSWSVPFPSRSFIGPKEPVTVSAPTVDSGSVYVGVSSLGTYGQFSDTEAFDATSGAARFPYLVHGGSGSAAVGEGVLAASVLDVYKPAPGPIWFNTLGVFDIATGASRFIAATGSASGILTFATFSSPSISNGLVYALTNNTLFAYDARGVVNCGNSQIPGGPVCLPLWSAPMRAAGGWDAMPAVANGLVYVPELDGNVEVFSASGCGVATCGSLWSAVAGSSHLAPVAVTGTTLFTASDDGRLSAFAASGCATVTCAPMWTATLGGAASQPSIAGSLVFVGSDAGTLSAFAAAGCGSATCGSLWSADVGAPVRTSPAISNGHVFVTDSSGTLHAYRLR